VRVRLRAKLLRCFNKSCQADLSRGNLRWNLRVAGPGVARHAVTLTNKERRALRVLRKHLEALEDWIAEFREVERIEPGTDPAMFHAIPAAMRHALPSENTWPSVPIDIRFDSVGGSPGVATFVNTVPEAPPSGTPIKQLRARRRFRYASVNQPQLGADALNHFVLLVVDWRRPAGRAIQR